jgi:hypothetical protein
MLSIAFKPKATLRSFVLVSNFPSDYYICNPGGREGLRRVDDDREVDQYRDGDDQILTSHYIKDMKLR